LIRAVQRDRPVRLLIADDNRDFAANLSDLARLHGFETKVVHSLTQARALAEDGSFDVAVIDQRLPDGRGIELLSRWRFDQPDLVPIIVTAFASVDSTLAALNQGAFAFVTKDSEPEVLLDALLRAAENAILRRENRRLRGTQEAILAALPDQLLIVDRQLTVHSANRRDPQLCSHEPRIVLPCPLLGFLAPGVVDRLDWNRLIRDVIETGSIEASLTIRMEGDKTRTYSVRATRLATELGGDSSANGRAPATNGSFNSSSDEGVTAQLASTSIQHRQGRIPGRVTRIGADRRTDRSRRTRASIVGIRRLGDARSTGRDHRARIAQSDHRHPRPRSDAEKDARSRTCRRGERRRNPVPDRSDELDSRRHPQLCAATRMERRSRPARGNGDPCHARGATLAGV
jgi:CheY-like chemotaxis protein